MSVRLARKDLANPVGSGARLVSRELFGMSHQDTDQIVSKHLELAFLRVMIFVQYERLFNIGMEGTG